MDQLKQKLATTPNLRKWKYTFQSLSFFRSGQIRSQSSGRKSLRVTSPWVACSMRTHFSIGTGLRQLIHWLTTGGFTWTTFAKADWEPRYSQAAIIDLFISSPSVRHCLTMCQALPNQCLNK